MLTVLKHTIIGFLDDNCPRMAAALAFYTAFSLAPLLIVVITICGFIWDPNDVEALLHTEFRGMVGEDGARQIQQMLRDASQPSRSGVSMVISIVALFFGATNVMVQLQSSLNDVWSVQPNPNRAGVLNFLIYRLLSAAMICGVAFLLLVSLVISSLLSAAGAAVSGFMPAGYSQMFLLTANTLVSYLVFAVLFAASFKLLPDAKVAWSDVWAGALLTSVLFVIGKFGFGFYLGARNLETVYGAAGSLALVLLWIFYSSLIFLLGAEFTQAWAKEKGKGWRPSRGAVRVVSQTVPVAGDNTLIRDEDDEDADAEEEESPAGQLEPTQTSPPPDPSGDGEPPRD